MSDNPDSDQESNSYRIWQYVTVTCLDLDTFLRTPERAADSDSQSSRSPTLHTARYALDARPRPAAR
eukprot:5834785-Prymnesium_polylepis.1